MLRSRSQNGTRPPAQHSMQYRNGFHDNFRSIINSRMSRWSSSKWLEIVLSAAHGPVMNSSGGTSPERIRCRDERCTLTAASRRLVQGVLRDGFDHKQFFASSISTSGALRSFILFGHPYCSSVTSWALIRQCAILSHSSVNQLPS